MNKQNGVWIESLTAGVLAIQYDFCTRQGKLHLADGHCCDMQGAVTMFQGIDPEVKSICTYSGTVPDTTFTKCESGWIPLHQN